MTYLLWYSSENVPSTSMWLCFLPQNVWGLQNTIQEAMTFNFSTQTEYSSDIFSNPEVISVDRRDFEPARDHN